MRTSKIFACLLALVFITQACSLPDQSLTPQVITVVVTATAPAAEKTPEISASATPATIPTSTPQASETSVPSPTSAPQTTATLAPSPTATQQAFQANTPSRTPAPQIPSVSNLPAQGPQGGDIDFEVVMSPVYLMRIKARKHGAANDGDGMDHVLFSVNKKNGGKVFSNTEKTAKYCIFQGGEPDCNPWPKSNGRYVWGAGGPEIVSGDYQVTIRAALKSDPTNESQWTFQITIRLP